MEIRFVYTSPWAKTKLIKQYKKGIINVISCDTNHHMQYKEATKRDHSRNGKIIKYFNGRSNSKTDTIKSFYCAEEREKSISDSEKYYIQEFTTSAGWSRRLNKIFQMSSV